MLFTVVLAASVAGKPPQGANPPQLCLPLPPKVESGLNQLINNQMQQRYTALAMASYFARVDVALNGFEDFFLELSEAKYDNALRLMQHLTTRCGKVVIDSIPNVGKIEWNSGLDAVLDALELQKNSTSAYVDLAKLAGENGDQNTQDILWAKFLRCEYSFIKKLGEKVTILKRVTTVEGLGETWANQLLGEIVDNEEEKLSCIGEDCE